MNNSSAVAPPPVRPAWLAVLGVWVLVACVRSFAIPMPSGGFRDLEGYRAVFFHVPLAWTGCVAFLVAAVYGGQFLVRRDLRADAMACGAAESGLVLCLLATITGMIFAKTQWGVAWNWDPRQTSIFFVLLIYAAYLVLRQAIGEDEALRARLSAAYLLLAVVPMMWLVMVFPRTQPASLHPEKAPFEGPHWLLMFENFAGLLGLFVVLMCLHSATAKVHAAARERW